MKPASSQKYQPTREHYAQHRMLAVKIISMLIILVACGTLVLFIAFVTSNAQRRLESASDLQLHERSTALVKNRFDASKSIDPSLVFSLRFSDSTGDRDYFEFQCNQSNRKYYGVVENTVWNPIGGRFQTGAFEFTKGDVVLVHDDMRFSPSNSNNRYTIAFFVEFSDTTFSFDNKPYIHFISKGNSDDGYEYAFRQYNASNVDGRKNRLSFYAFNPGGGWGVGSYVQENIVPGTWIHIAGVVNGKEILLYKDGVLKDREPFATYNVQMKDTDAPLILGGSFQGSIDDFLIYNRALNSSEIRELSRQKKGSAARNGLQDCVPVL